MVLLYSSFAHIWVNDTRDALVFIIFRVLLFSLVLEQISLVSLLQVFSLLPCHLTIHDLLNVNL
jgi:hypothetical protein